MSLHDTSKDHPHRLNPEPNQNDEQLQRMAHGTTQHQTSKDSASVDGLKFFERYIVVKYQGFNKAVFGFLNSTNKFGLKVAKDGYDVLTTPNTNLIFNSDQNIFKIAQSGTITIPAITPSTPGAGNFANNSSGISISHDLDYVPVCLAFMNNNGVDLYSQLPHLFMSYASGGTTALWTNWSVDVTSSSLIFNIATTSTGAPGNIVAQNVKYYVLQETSA